MSARFKGKACLVTGAAYGLGRAVAQGLAREGADLFLVDVKAEPLEAVRTELAERGTRCAVLATDLAERGNCRAAVEAAVKAYGRLDVLCNIAGIVRFHRIEEVSEAEMQKLFAVNLMAPFWLSQAALPHLMKSAGNIVNCASQAAHKGTAYIVPYSMTKGGVTMMTKGMAMELMDTPVRVNAVSPGTMVTNIGEGVVRPDGLDAALMARYSGIRPPSAPEDVAALVLHVASDEARAIHGAILCADGGVTAD